MMQHDHHRYVDFFDVLGMQQAIQRNLDEAWGALCDFNQAYKEILKLYIEIPSSEKIIEDHIRKCILSDSMVLYTLSDKVEDLFSIIILSAEVFKNALRSCVPLRGAIAYGRFFYNDEERLYLGDAQVKAYQLSEASNWLGIVVDEQVRERSQSTPFKSNGKDVLIPWDVPLKDGSIVRRTILNWPVVFQNNFTELPLTAERFFSVAFEKRFGPYHELKPSVKAKYENTVNFINTQIGPSDKTNPAHQGGRG